MQTEKKLNPHYARLLTNPDFQLFLKAMESHRKWLFEASESETQLPQIFEMKGKRKMLKILLDEVSTNALFEHINK